MKLKTLFRIAAAAVSAVMLAGAVSAQSEEAVYLEEGSFRTAIDTPSYTSAPKAVKQYHGDYGYNILGDMENGAARQELYNLIDAAAAEFHSDYTLNAPYQGFVVELKFSDLGLTSMEAIEVWRTYRNDHPLYYWISNSVMYNDQAIVLVADDSYRMGSTRKKCNELLEEELAEYLELTDGETSAYRIAMAYHDAIIAAVDYAYEKDGQTPQDDSWAHNIMGVMEEKGAVCEGFARTYQLLLNLSGVENIFVAGRAGEDHAWNMVKLDDGQWYWCDLTWDDCPDWMWGVQYNYFCVNDTENVMWTDGGYSVPSAASFISNHTPDSVTSVGVDWQYPLPARASGAYAGVEDEVLLRETFTVGQFTCAVAGYRAVQITGIDCQSGDVVIPDTVEYNGVTYDVISIGKITDDGLFEDGTIELTGAELKTVTIPETVIFIWDNALRFASVEAYHVDEGNTVYSSQDGVLFTDSLYTLIAYPSNREGTEYTLPEETAMIAYCAFEECAYLEKIQLGAAVNTVGAVNMGDRYCDNEAQAAAAYVMDYEWSRITKALTGSKEVSVDPANTVYTSADGVLYEITEDDELIVLHAAKDIESAELLPGTVGVKNGAFANCIALKELVLPDGLETIDDYAFFDCGELTEVTIPASVTTLGDCAFEYCRNLKDVYFEGDVPADWEDDVFGNTHAELVLYYPDDNTSGWTSPEWTGPDGVVYKTALMSDATEPEITWLLGDVNGDNAITAQDARYVLRYAVGYIDEGVEITHGDVNGDGEITAQDARYVLRHAVGYDDKLGIGTVQTGKQ